MSRTDKTRPWRVQHADPHNQRFRMVGCTMWPTDGTSEWFWKKLEGASCRTCCSQKFSYQWEQRKSRCDWRQERQKLLKQARGGGDADL